VDLPDARLSGKIAGYRLDGYIGQSDMGTVYLAQDERLDRRVALKVLAPELAGQAAFRARLLRESRAAAAVGHPHIMPVYEAVDADGILYVAMRYVQDGDTRSLLNRLGPLPLAPAWSIIAQVASALDAAHARGLIHRDVKPANILLEGGSASGDGTPHQAEGRAGHMYLSDFGMGTDTSVGQFITTGQFIGTLDYVAPEQIEGRALDGRTDLYSLACVGFELLCGTPLFEQDQGLTVMYAQLYAPPPSAKARRPELAAAVDRVLATALAKNPADRHATCGQFAEELFEALGLAGQPATPARSRPSGDAGLDPRSGPEPARIQAPAPTGPPQPSPEPVSEAARPAAQRPSRRPRVIKLILAVGAAAIAAAVAVGVAAPNRPAPRTPAVSRPADTSAPSPSPSRTPSASALAPGQAAAVVNNLLGSSTATRKALYGAVGEVANCTNVSSAASLIQNAVSQRGAEYSQASALSVSALPDGAAVKADLIAALRTSLDADRDYLTWARQQLNQGCTAPAQSSAYRAAYSAAQDADAAKEAFVHLWNPVAAKYGVPQKSSGSI
jgi:serine/threonine-protein kinase